MLSLYELAGQNQDVLGIYGPKYIVAYALSLVTSFVEVKLVSTKESRAKVKNFLGKLNHFPERKSFKNNLEGIVSGE